MEALPSCPFVRTVILHNFRKGSHWHVFCMVLKLFQISRIIGTPLSKPGPMTGAGGFVGFSLATGASPSALCQCGVLPMLCTAVLVCRNTN